MVIKKSTTETQRHRDISGEFAESSLCLCASVVKNAEASVRPKNNRSVFSRLILSLLQLCLAIVWLTLPGAVVFAQQEQEPKKEQEDEGTISLDTTLVVLNVTVTDAGGKYVNGLREKDFRVFEDKARQKITSFSFEETPFAAVILLDISGSMGEKMALARSACTNFVEGIREGDVTAIYSFGDKGVKKIQDFSEVRGVDPLLWETRAKGMTPLYDAIVKATEELSKRPERRRAIVVLSDGADTFSKHSMDHALKQTLQGQITIYSVDMSDAALYRSGAPAQGTEVLKSLAGKTGGRFFASPGGRQLREAFEQTVEELRNQYTITYEPTNDKRDGKWRAIEVQSHAIHVVRTRQGYYAAKDKK